MFCNKISEASVAPPLKNEPVPTCNQLEPGSAPSKAAAESVGVVAPFTCHNANWPLVLCKLISIVGATTGSLSVTVTVTVVVSSTVGVATKVAGSSNTVPSLLAPPCRPEHIACRVDG